MDEIMGLLKELAAQRRDIDRAIVAKFHYLDMRLTLVERHVGVYDGPENNQHTHEWGKWGRVQRDMGVGAPHQYKKCKTCLLVERKWVRDIGDK